eukprot:76065-Prorocentrum_minimum.AAC.1
MPETAPCAVMIMSRPGALGACGVTIVSRPRQDRKSPSARAVCQLRRTGGALTECGVVIGAHPMTKGAYLMTKGAHRALLGVQIG